MATEKEVSGGLGLEWRVTVPEGSSVKMEPEPSWISRTWNRLVELGSKLRSKVSTFGKKVWKIGADSPRKVIHGAKVGAALTLVSLFYYLRPLYNGFGSSAMWAVMTVVVVFEYTVGGCLYKGINRAIATLSAGGLAVGIDWVASKSGESWEPVILSASVFLLASAATFSRFLPTVKARFDYGVTIFILTFSLVAVSGYRVEELINLAVQRIATIAIGIAIALSICILVYPVWSGQELHLLVSRNMEKLADSLEGCVEDYFMKSEITDAKESSATRSEGYKCVLNSKASEDSQANLARWEPAHGRFGFRHPWKQYLKVAAALRNCAYCVEALHGCINSEAKAPECMKKHLRDACMKLSSDSSKVLKELSSSIKLMKRSKSIDALVGEMKNAVHELQNAFASLPNHLTQTTASSPIESTEGKKNSNISIADGVALMEAMPLMTIASLLIEISARIQGVVDAVGTLATLARFEGIRNEKSSSKVQAEEQEDKALQEV
ncbi:unnamed protein product [Musa acuminata subsp. malaccensis]|uniref:(wild Malaysian banana) hypothetical protein n=1 Tax=Musa acuminata subsp. malaccensis TaxID=214687 RepID=A0A804KKZ0_MUSAM|nr:PREDICTED: aluminum-activated malate transporter 10-like [Musa acuminata subsp. malaccensis]CAG1835779.1 unnamed protein product [Musa acuminata subsp. malaccensis]